MTEQELIQSIIHKALQSGAEEAEVYLERGVSSEITWRKNALDKMKTEETFGAGLRIRKNGKVGFSYSSDLNYPGIDKLVHRAGETCVYGKEGASLFLPKQSNRKIPITYDDRIRNITLREKTELIKETESIVRSSDKRITGLDETGVETGYSEFFLGDSNGALYEGESSFACLSCQAFAGNHNETRSGYGVDIAVNWKELSAQKVGRECASEATELLGAIQPESGNMDLILSPAVARQFIGILANCFSAEAVWKKKSFLEGQLGAEIGSRYITLIDDGTLDNRLGSGICDGEGTAMQKTVLMEKGMVTSYLVDRAMSDSMGMAPTGNGVRSGYMSLPHIGTTNLILAPGEVSEKTLICDVKNGVYITQIMGAHTVNPISGNMSLGASGILIENGILTVPVDRMTIAGNLRQFLSNCDGVADNAEVLGSKSAPSVRIRNIMVSGK